MLSSAATQARSSVSPEGRVLLLLEACYSGVVVVFFFLFQIFFLNFISEK